MFKTQVEPREAGEWFHCKVFMASFLWSIGVSTMENCGRFVFYNNIYFTKNEKQNNRHTAWNVASFPTIALDQSAGEDSLSYCKKPYSPLKKRGGNWVELTLAKTSEAVTRDREKKLATTDRRVSSNYPRNNFGAHFDSSPLLVSKVVNRLKNDVCLGPRFGDTRHREIHRFRPHVIMPLSPYTRWPSLFLGAKGCLHVYLKFFFKKSRANLAIFSQVKPDKMIMNKKA